MTGHALVAGVTGLGRVRSADALGRTLGRRVVRRVEAASGGRGAVHAALLGSGIVLASDGGTTR